MANKEIVPYGFDPSKKPNALALTIVPLEVTPFAQASLTSPMPSIIRSLFRCRHVHFWKTSHANKSLI